MSFIRDILPPTSLCGSGTTEFCFARKYLRFQNNSDSPLETGPSLEMIFLNRFTYCCVRCVISRQLQLTDLSFPKQNNGDPLNWRKIDILPSHSLVFLLKISSLLFTECRSFNPSLQLFSKREYDILSSFDISTELQSKMLM